MVFWQTGCSSEFIFASDASKLLRTIANISWLVGKPKLANLSANIDKVHNQSDKIVVFCVHLKLYPQSQNSETQWTN